LGRRNLNPNQIAYLRGKRYETEKKIQGAPIGNKNAEKQSSHLANLVYSQPKTSEVLGSEYGVASSTISRSANFAKVVDILPTETKNIVLSGAEKISHADTSTILKMDKTTQKKFLKEKNGITFLSIW
jgi:DNA-binding transcriptional regulator LsrR (DeoR family)